MKKVIYVLSIIMVILFCAGCGKEDDEKGISFAEVKQEIHAELEEAKNGKYENLNIVCDGVRLPESEQLKKMRFPVYEFTDGMLLKEKANFYEDIVYPKLLDVEDVKPEYFKVHITSLEDGTRIDGDYTYLLEHVEKLEERDDIQLWWTYKDDENYYSIETMPEGICFNISQGKLAKLNGRNSPFAANNYEKVKTYNCYIDDLSDSYPLMDGTQKTVAEAKAEIEAYLDAHYPIVGEDNAVRNEVYEIVVGKIPNSEYYVFDGYRTFSYEGIRVKEHTEGGLKNEVGVMGQALLCESNKVDVLLGLVNCYESGTVVKEYEEYLPFADVMETLSLYMTGNTGFDICDIGLEYRMFTEVVEGKTYYIWIPYWAFRLENPNDDSVIRVYINIETGEAESFDISQ